MHSVTEIAKAIVAREGGYVNDPDDPGGATKYGVTLHTMRRLGMDLTGDGRISSADVRRLSRAATEVLAMIADEAIQIHGGMGLMDDLPLARFWRDARVERIWDGTSEIQRHIISRDLLRSGANIAEMNCLERAPVMRMTQKDRAAVSGLHKLCVPGRHIVHHDRHMTIAVAVGVGLLPSLVPGQFDLGIGLGIAQVHQRKLREVLPVRRGQRQHLAVEPKRGLQIAHPEHHVVSSPR